MAQINKNKNQYYISTKLKYYINICILFIIKKIALNLITNEYKLQINKNF